MKLDTLDYANQTETKKGRLPIIAMIVGLTSGPLALAVGKMVGIFVVSTERFWCQNIGFYSWLALSFAAGAASLVCIRARRFCSILAVFLTCMWGTIAISIEWWLLHLPLGPGL